jgi:HEPN domain-containing protein
MSEFELVKEWFRFAANDLIVARHCYHDLHPKQTEIACYHCQQCLEKALKGFLIFKDIEPPKIHNLVYLCNMCINIEASFEIILDKCADLRHFSSDVRYPQELSPDNSITESAITKAHDVFAFCAAKIPEINTTDFF